MLTVSRTPQQGLNILEKLHTANPFHQCIHNNLLNTYIKLGYHNKAMAMINHLPNNKIRWFDAWLAHKNNDICQERDIWNTLLNQGYFPQIHNLVKTLIAKTTKPLTLRETDVPLFCVQRNEMIKLPAFLEYYRNLGITKFIFIDNNSDDGSFEFLIEQPDCYVYWTNDSYLQSSHGLIWLNHLINETDILHIDQWYLIADVDEFLVYPNCENRKLPILIDYLNQEKSEAVASFMLDMYADNLLGYNDEQFIDEHIYFYNNYQTFYQIESPYIKIAGGIRNHLFSEYNDYHVKTALFKKLPHKSFLISSTHKTTPYKISKLTTAFKHYKFVNLKEVAKREIQRKQHSGGGSRYRHYHNQLNNSNEFDLLHLPKTTKYQNSQQLVELGLIKNPLEWVDFIHHNKVDRTPRQGLKVLEDLYHKNSNHQTVFTNLINSYIKLSYYDKAIQMINNIPKNKSDTQTLQWRAWVEHKNGNAEKEKQIWQTILNKSFYSEVHRASENLIYKNYHKTIHDIVLQENDIPLICVERNEMLRLPFFLKYYRQLGVTTFFFVDNNSDDGSLEFLLSQPDCHVFWTDELFSLTSFGGRWWKYIIDNFIPKNQWFLLQDADEFLIYPNSERVKLEDLIKYLDDKNYEALPSFCCDMFPANLDEQLAINNQDNLIEKSPYFYNNFVTYGQTTCPYYHVYGGIRYQLNNNMPCLTMVSLLKNIDNLFFLSSRHAISPFKLSDVSSTSLHFKFIGNFKQIAIEEMQRKQRNYAGYIKMYEEIIDKNFDFTKLPKTVKYENSQQLVDLGLIQTSQDWESFTQVKNIKTPSRGLSILESLYQKHPNYEGIRNNLINIYIRFNHIDKAKKLIEQKPVNHHNIQSLQYYAWLAHQNNDAQQELAYWLAIFQKRLHFLSTQEREYLLSQAITNEEKISLCKENWDVLFNYSHSAMPVKLQNLLGSTINNVVLIANNREITLEHLNQYIQENDLIVCFNHNIFLNFYENFPHNPKLLFFRKENHLNYNFLGLPQASMMEIDTKKLYDVMQQPLTYFLFNEHLPHTLELPDDIYQKTYNPQFTGIISQFHRIFHYMQPPNFYFNTSLLTPTSGFMVLKYLYYTRLHLLNLGKPSFNIKLLGFNFTNNSFYQTHGVHNWEYERSQQENLPDSIQRIIVP